MENTIEIWCDGSFRQAHKTSGAGWVIRHPDGRMEQQALTLPTLKNSFGYGSHIAELSAATHAMNAIPANSHVVMHMDCRMAIESLEAGALTIRSREPAPALLSAFRHAAEAKSRLGTVTFTHTRDNVDPQMGKAHRLSRVASAPVTL